MKDLTIKIHFWFMNYQLNQTPCCNILFFIFFGNFSLGGSTVLFFFTCNIIKNLIQIRIKSLNKTHGMRLKITCFGSIKS